jgi:hypothetical protein
MEAISSFLEGIKERFTNPFISSFAIAWFVVNWPITIALFWYDPPKGSPGHEYLIDFIRTSIDPWESSKAPLLFALGYTFVFPLMKLAISGFATLIGKWSDHLDMWVLQGAKVPMTKFLKLRKEHDEQSNELQRLIQLELPTTTENLELKTQLEKSRVDIVELRKHLSDEQSKKSDLSNEILNISNVKRLDGTWEVMSVNWETGKEELWKLEIQDGQVYVIYKTEKQLVWYVRGLLVNRSNNKVSFVFVRTPSSSRAITIQFIEQRSLPFYFATYYYELFTTPDFGMMQGYQHSEDTFHRVQFVNSKVRDTGTYDKVFNELKKIEENSQA